MSFKKISLIPSYEPKDNLINLVKELSKENFDIVLVDDGSGSDYDEIFTKCKKHAKVITYKENKGKGYALKKGIKYIIDNYDGQYIVVTMDCDGQHTIKDANKLVEESNRNKNALVLGKRIRSNKTPIRSRIGNAVTRLIYRITTGIDIYDTQTGLRAFSNELINYLINIEGNRFEYEMNVLLRCAKDKVKIKEIEIATIYIDNNSNTHFNGLKDSYRIYKEIIKHNLTKGRK